MVLNKTLLSTKDLAEYTGYSIHSIYSMIKNNTIPYYKPNRKVFFKKEDIDRWLDSNRKLSKDEIKEQATNFLKSSK